MVRTPTDTLLAHMRLAEAVSRTFWRHGKNSPVHLEACRLRDESLERLREMQEQTLGS